MRVLTALLVAASLVSAPRVLDAQERGAAALSEAVRGLGVTTRVLMVGAHPDDEDTQLITWLARGERVETAYLSLTRGDGGQNLIGNELGEALGVIRTEELLAARRVDGGRQYFTRAYDFGFSKSAAETYAHWDRELLLRDVVSVVRAFRPHVIVSVFSGTPRDGHGHHQVAGMLAREAFDVAGDTVRMPARSTHHIGPWTPAKFYRSQRFRPEGATLRMNVGEYDPVLGRSYAEIAGESRSQHRSQGFGALQPRGVRWGYVRLEASRVSDTAQAAGERSLFDGIQAGWARFDGVNLPAPLRAAIDSLPHALARVQRELVLREPATAVEPLAAYVRLARNALDSAGTHHAPSRPGRCLIVQVPACGGVLGDLVVSLAVALERAERALLGAAGVAVEATVTRSFIAVGDTLPVAVSVYNRGRWPVEVQQLSLDATSGAAGRLTRGNLHGWDIPPDSVFGDTLELVPTGRSGIPWLRLPRAGAMFTSGVADLVKGGGGVRSPAVTVHLEIAGAPVRSVAEPVVHRYADPSEGEVRRPVAAVPAITLLLEREVEYLPAGREVERTVRVVVRSATPRERTVEVSLSVPPGLRVDSPTRTVHLGPAGQASVQFTLRGALPAGTAQVTAVAMSEGERFSTGYVPIAYPHIAPNELYRPAVMQYAVVDVSLPPGLNVAYIPGVGDNTPPMLRQLGIPVTLVDTAQLAAFDFSGFSTVVVGPRAYASSEALVAANPRLLEFARRGGTVVVQYGQYEMMRPGMMPYPIVLARPHDRVTIEEAPVRVLDESAPLVQTPNTISAADFSGWVQERGLYMPRTFDTTYVPLLELNDPGEPANRGAVLVAPLGRGTYVYTTLSFFRQLPAGVPGAARLFVNLLGAGLAAPRS